MAEFRQTKYIDDNQNVVTRIEIVQTPAEFLRENGEVWNFAESMKPGHLPNQTIKQLEGK